jgi:transcriptional regulator with XRE-family HTH domain
MSQKELARRTGIPPDTLRRLEDETLELSPDQAKRIAIVTGLDLKKFLSGQVVRSKRTVDWRARLRSSQQLFETLIEELLETEAAPEIANRQRELFYYLFSQWVAGIVAQLKLNRSLLERIERLHRDGIVFIVPESLLSPDKKERTRWFKERAAAYTRIDENGKRRESPVHKRLKKIQAEEASAFRNAHQREAAELHGLEAKIYGVGGLQYGPSTEEERKRLVELLEMREQFSQRTR